MKVSWNVEIGKPTTRHLTYNPQISAMRHGQYANVSLDFIGGSSCGCDVAESN